MRAPILAVVLATLTSSPAAAQHLQGRINLPPPATVWVFLQQARGGAYFPFDSVRTGPGGSFHFPTAMYQAGFYRLALNDSDHVDLILNPRETRVELEFDSIPLQDHMKVIASDENKRLWEYNYVNKETQAVLTETAARRTKLLPTDTASITALDSADRRAMNLQTNYLDHLVSTAPDSYFAKVLSVDKALAGVRGRGARAVANSCNFSDPALLHSSVYDRGVMAYLQNLNITNDHQILAGTDSLVALASGNPDCKNYMVEHLVDLFATYGPQSALEHVINEFAPPGSKVPVPPRLKAKVDALMKLAVGHTAPDISLNDHGTEVPLSSLVKPHRYTAIFFYSSTCEHCHAQMPAMKADLARFHDKGFDVVGIALDVDSTDFLKSISENAIPWRCFSEFNGWGAKSAKAFMVSATPTFFLLDDKLKIVAKPTDADELGKTLVDLYR